MRKRKWIISAVEDSETVYWNNEYGWVSSNPTTYSDEERKRFRLPIGFKVEWIAVYPKEKNKHETERIS